MDFKKTILIFYVVVYVATIVFVIRFPSLLAASISNIELVEEANKERIDRDIQPLKYSKKLERAAEEKAQDMFKKQYWSHFGPQQETPWRFITETGYQYTFAGENLARGFSDSPDIHEAWMNSQSHRENILDASYDEVGIAIVKGKLLGIETFLVVEMFGSENIKTNLTRNTDYPTLKISYPQEGDILQNGAFTVYGEARKLQGDAVRIFLGDQFYESTTVKDNIFSTTNQDKKPIAGDITVFSRGTGTGEEYLFDSVKIKVISSQDTGEDYTKCISSHEDALNIIFTYGCSDASIVKNMKLTVSGIIVNSELGNSVSIQVPINSITGEGLVYEIVVYYTDGTSRFVQIRREKKEQFTSAGITQLVSQITAKDIVLIGTGILLFISGVFTAYILKKREFTQHKHQVVVMVSALLILIIFISKGAITL